MWTLWRRKLGNTVTFPVGIGMGSVGIGDSSFRLHLRETRWHGRILCDASSWDRRGIGWDRACYLQGSVWDRLGSGVVFAGIGCVICRDRVRYLQGSVWDRLGSCWYNHPKSGQKIVSQEEQSRRK